MRTLMLTRRGGDDMSGKSIISNSYLEDIGDAIRYKKGTEETFYPSQMGDAIRSIEGIVPVGSIEIDANGVYDVTEKAEAVVSVNPDLRPLSVSENGTYEPEGFDGYLSVTADIEPNLTSLAVTENGLYLPESGVDGYDRVTVDVPPTVPDLVPLDATANGKYLPTGHDGYSQVNVAVPIPEPVTEPLSVTENGTYTPASGVDGFNEVVVNVSAEEEWDGELVPDDSNPGYFHCRVINLLATDTLVIEGKGTGYRWASTKSNMPQFEHFGQDFSTGKDVSAVYFHMRGYLVPLGDTTVVIGGPAWGADGAVYTGNYSFKGDYLHWKVIHQP